MSSQDGLSSAIFKRLVTTIMKINAAWVKNTTSDRGKVTELQNLHKEFSLELFSMMSSTAMQSAISTACFSLLMKNDFDFKIFWFSHIQTSHTSQVEKMYLLKASLDFIDIRKSQVFFASDWYIAICVTPGVH